MEDIKSLKKALVWPFDSSLIRRKCKRMKKDLLTQTKSWVDVRIAVLGGSTTNDLIEQMELFLLSEGIRPSFYVSEYSRYWEDGVFENEELDSFAPQIITIFTTSRNIKKWPTTEMDNSEISQLLDEQYNHFETLWSSLSGKYDCTIIQNNFERPFYRLLGNQDICNPQGRSNFVFRLNGKLYDYAQAHKNFYVHDIDYLSAAYGFEEWLDPQSWDLYKSACHVKAWPEVSFSLSRIIKSSLGKNKKALALDLDNTLWKGVVGDDGPDNLEMSDETATGEGYQHFQSYLLDVKRLGALLTVNSKNDEKNALEGLSHPDCLLPPDEFVSIRANWMTKDRNLLDLADEIGIGVDSFVFVDDNPVEREIVQSQVPSVTAVTFADPEECIRVLDRNGFFEPLHLTADDRIRNEMYKANVSRKKQEKAFGNYEDFLNSLNMKATIKDFEPVYMPRITQLTNKTNQFNLTTKRYSEAEMNAVFESSNYIRLYGKLEDKFGDNGLVSVVIGHLEDKILHIDLWLMSCRVLKRNMEYAMFDCLVEECQKRGVDEIRGYYYPTPKNGMVRDFYADLGFTKVSEDEHGSTEWLYYPKDHKSKNTVIHEVLR